jgi:uncharacterized protein (DUF362 family)
MKPIVSAVQVNKRSRKAFIRSVETAMVKAEWTKRVRGKRVFVKVNYMSDQVVPGQCTSPWVLDAVLTVLKKAGKQVIVGDTDVATQRQLRTSIRKWGALDVCRKHQVRFVNLSLDKLVETHTGGSAAPVIGVPRVLCAVDNIITLPVAKTHNVTTMSASLKNQWGCLPRVRHRYHLVADKVIAEINKTLKVSFVVVDATVCMEGDGPRVGVPRVMDQVIASGDLVAADAAVCTMMGIDPKDVGHIMESERLGVGSTDYRVIGKLNTAKFEQALLSRHPIVWMEMKLRKIPVISHLLFNTWFFRVPAWIASRYNAWWWYYRKGRRYAKGIVKSDQFYREQFGGLIG